MTAGFLACFQPCWSRHLDDGPKGNDADSLGRVRAVQADSFTLSRGSLDRIAEQPIPLASRAPRDAADPSLVRSPSTCSDASRHSTVPSARYRKVKQLNSGANGEVSLAMDKQTGEQVAIKLVPRGCGAQAELCSRELLNHQKCAGHPNVVAIRDVFLTRNHLALVLEYANDGDLSQVISRHLVSQGGPLPEARARALFQQLISAVDYSHRLNVACRDIKLDNILLSSPATRHSGVGHMSIGNSPAAATTAAAVALQAHLNSTAAASGASKLRHSLSGGSSMSAASVASLSISSAGSVGAAAQGPAAGDGASGGSLWHKVQQLKLADFGLSKGMEEEVVPGVRGTVCGTPEYMAPEILRGHEYDGRKVDIWSCGVVLYVMVAGNYPFLDFREERMTRPERMCRMFPRILSGGFYPLPDGSSPELADLLRQMLTADPARRISMTGILQHPWFLQDLPPALATLNDRLLAARLVSPAPPVMSPGIAAALEATAGGMPDPASISEVPQAALQGRQQPRSDVVPR